MNFKTITSFNRKNGGAMTMNVARKPLTVEKGHKIWESNGAQGAISEKKKN